MPPLTDHQRGAEERHPGKQVGYQLLGPGGGLFEDITGQHLPAGKNDHGQKAAAGQDI